MHMHVYIYYKCTLPVLFFMVIFFLPFLADFVPDFYNYIITMTTFNQRYDLNKKLRVEATVV